VTSCLIIGGWKELGEAARNVIKKRKKKKNPQKVLLGEQKNLEKTTQKRERVAKGKESRGETSTADRHGNK